MTTTAIRYEVGDGQEHWPQIQELLSRIYMTSTASIAIGRRGAQIRDAYPGFLGEQRVCCAFAGDRLVGYVRGSIEDYRLGGAVRRLAYMGDHRVDPDYRGQRIASVVADKLFASLAESGIKQGFYYVNAGNTAQDKMMSRIKGLRHARAAAFVTTTRLLPARPADRASSALERVKDPRVCFPAWLADGTHDLTLHTDRAGWESFLARFPEIRFYARRETPDEIELALFDQARFKEIKMDGYPSKVRLLRAAWNLGTRWSGAEKFPSERETWHMADLCFCRPGLDLTPEVLAFCRSEAFAAGCQVLNYIVPAARERGLLANHITTHLCTWALGDEPVPTLAPGRPFVDLAFV